MSNEKKQSPPVDRWNAVGLIIFVLGVGTLLPWNFFITASQYFNCRLSVPLNSSSNSTVIVKNYNYDSWMALLSQLPLLVFSLLNSFLVQHVRERVRVSFSLVGIMVLFGITAALVRVQMEPDTFFGVTMATIWFISMCSAVLQGSLFGVAGLLPPRYNTLFMSGQGLAGIFAAIAMLLSILVGNSDIASDALGYFITPCVATLVTLLCYLLLPHLDFARFYLDRNSFYDLETSHELLKASGMNAKMLEANGVLKRAEVDSQPLSVFAVFKKIWLMALCVTCLFMVTLSVFPVITVRVQTTYTDNKAWAKVFTCVCCFIVFNAMDLVGRSVPYLVMWPSKDSRLFPVAIVSRVVFVPLLMLCNVSNSKLNWVLFSHDVWFVFIMALFAFTNGYLASLCMGYAPQFVRGKDAETAGSLMTFFLILGLALGAAFSFLLGNIV